MLLTRWTALLVLVPFLTGCTTATGPLTDPKIGKIDESLIGHWAGLKKEEGNQAEIHLFIGKPEVKNWSRPYKKEEGNRAGIHLSINFEVEKKPKGIMECASIEWDRANQKINDAKWFFSVSKIGKTSYINLFLTGSYENQKNDCLIFRYRCDGQTLQLWSIDEEKVGQLGNEGHLTLNMEKIFQRVSVESLAAYLTKNGGEDLFSKESTCVFSRVPAFNPKKEQPPKDSKK